MAQPGRMSEAASRQQRQAAQGQLYWGFGTERQHFRPGSSTVHCSGHSRHISRGVPDRPYYGVTGLGRARHHAQNWQHAIDIALNIPCLALQVDV